MSFIHKLSNAIKSTIGFKGLIGIYVLLVLAFSSVSKSEVRYAQEEQTHLNFFEEKNGIVFESNGYLFFDEGEGNIFLVHSNNHDFFENLNLPIRITAQTLFVQQPIGFSNSIRTVLLNVKNLSSSKESFKSFHLPL